MSAQHLTLEILSGPLDGTTVMLEAATEWSKTSASPLAFPWDAELGTPQARFVPDVEGWHLEGAKSLHGTYRANSGERITTETLQLAEGNVLKASDTWLIVLPKANKLKFG